MIVAVTGATGFVGGAVTRLLLRRGHDVRVLVREPGRAGGLADLGGVELVPGHLHEEEALAALVAGSDVVVHLVGIISETRGRTFESVHVGGTKRLTAAAKAAGVRRFVHMSALGARAEAAATDYHRTKAAGEESVRASGLPHVILRPSIVAGPGNQAIGMMVDMVRLAPFVPVIGDGLYRLQPVWLGDVAEVFALSVERADLGGTFELGGPDQLTWHQMLDAIEAALAVERRRLRVPVGVARFAALAGLALPRLAPISPDQLQMLLEGNTTASNAIDTVFGIRPRPFADVAREICAPFAPPGAGA